MPVVTKVAPPVVTQKKRGRPKGAKNKPKVVVAVIEQVPEIVDIPEVIFTYKNEKCGCYMGTSLSKVDVYCKHGHKLTY